MHSFHLRFDSRILGPRWLALALTALLLAVLGGCGSTEERAQYHYERGVALAKDGELAKAAVEFRNALALDGDMVPALYAAADVEQRANRLDRAAGLLQRVTELDPGHVDARIRLGGILLAAGDLERASKILDEAMRLDPTRPDVLVSRAALALKLEKPDQAVELANAALKVQPAMPEALMVLASVRLGDEDTDGAIALVDQGLTRDPGNLGLALLRIKALEAAGDHAGVEQALAKLVSLRPDNKSIRLALVGGYIANNKIDAAEKEFRHVLQLAPTDGDLALAFINFLKQYKGEDAARAELVKGSSEGPNSFRYSLALAQMDIDAGKTTEGESVLRDLVAAHADKTPEAMTAKTELARLLLQTDRHAEAAGLIQEVLAVDHHQVEALTLRGWMHLKTGDFDDAIVDLRAGLSEAPHSIPINLILAEVYERRGQIDLAEEHLAFVAQESGYDPEKSRAYILFLQRHQDFDRAEQVLSEILSRHPRNTVIAAALAAVRLRKQDWAGAMELTDITRQGADPSKISDRIAAAALIGEGHFDDGIALLQGLRAKDPQAPGPLASMVQAYLGAGKTGDAEALLKSVLADNPQSPYGRVLLALIELSKGNTEGAVTDATKAVQENPDSLEAVRVSAVAHLRAGKSAEALHVVDQALEHMRGNTDLRLLRAGILEQNGNIDDAIAVYEDMLQTNPSMQVALNNLASLLSQYRSDPESLSRASDLAKQLNPYASPHFQDTIGWIHYLRTEYGLAKPLLESAAQGLPNMPVVRYHLAMVYLALGQNDSALDNLEKALDLAKTTAFPQMADARSALSKIRSGSSMSGQIESAVPAPPSNKPLPQLNSGSGARPPQGS